MGKAMTPQARALMKQPQAGAAPPPGWRPAALPRGNPVKAGTVVRDKANARAAEMAPVIEGLRAEGFTTVRALCAELAAREVPTARGGAWNTREVQRLLKRIAAGSIAAATTCRQGHEVPAERSPDPVARTRARPCP